MNEAGMRCVVEWVMSVRRGSRSCDGIGCGEWMVCGAGKEWKEERFENLGRRRSIYPRVFDLDANKHQTRLSRVDLTSLGKGRNSSLAGRRNRCGDSERSENIKLCSDLLQAAREELTSRMT